ncbi:SDR family oxidoreductase [Bradyrhizobium yuanmingense]|uniref:SDR family oxidoreductase n=1 Tax=Bradyrhizobium yuanmingense TaxID=108015 RepID=UPI0021A579B4|nr:SDR family oxidoreductase [Bradyrhizobium sp. CB1024]UWU83118.1 SDR family oxidoreductase [Bradyrhizobium sp. CB1024]
MTKVLITGANRGIGLALARQYATDGAEVIACCRDPSTADSLEELVASFGRQVRITQLDVADDASIASLKRAVGDVPLDILINNAGINGTPKAQSAERIDVEGWMTTMRINALAPILIAQAMRDNLLRSSEKKLVAISSDYASTGTNYGSSRDRYAYRASKAALNNGMRALARDWAEDGILVGILYPGWVRTDMGGERASASPTSISAEHSALCLTRRIAELTPATSGAFLDYNGETLDW